jgi:hypothetical protein
MFTEVDQSLWTYAGPSEAATNLQLYYARRDKRLKYSVALHYRRHGVELHLDSLSTGSRHLLGVGRSLSCRLQSDLSNSALRVPGWPNNQF